MDISAKTKVHDLIQEHPFLEHFLVEYEPRFGQLRNPVVRNTLGRVATLEMAASIAGKPVEDLVSEVRAEIEKHRVGNSTIPARGDRAERAEILKGIIRDLHAGEDPGELKDRFARLIRDVGAGEIASVEQQLVDEGIPEEEIKRLCDVHVEVLKSSLERQLPRETPPGHPVHTFRSENDALGAVVEELKNLLEGLGDPPHAERLAEGRTKIESAVNRLSAIERHYLRKEYQLFPFLEKHGVTAPPQVMWAIHDDVRSLLKDVRAAIEDRDAVALRDKGSELARAVADMIYKENKILLPMALETLGEDEWAEMQSGEGEFGYALVTPGNEWKPETTTAEASPASHPGPGTLRMDTGALTLDQVNLLLTHLPVDITFVDERDKVRYYSATRERIFPRSPGIIGRKVQNCHPRKSLHVVNRILEEFRAGSRDSAEFWIQSGGAFIHIRYFALRDRKGHYRGTVEVMQDVTNIRQLEGERRLLET